MVIIAPVLPEQQDRYGQSTSGEPDFEGRRLHKGEAVEMAIHEWLPMEEPGFQRDGIAIS